MEQGSTSVHPRRLPPSSCICRRVLLPYPTLRTAPVAREQELVVYQLPEHAHFYAELVNLLESADAGAAAPTVTVLFSRFDAARLERVVGATRAARMLSRAATTFVLC